MLLWLADYGGEDRGQFCRKAVEFFFFFIIGKKLRGRFGIAMSTATP